jgi:hypothetical protein
MCTTIAVLLFAIYVYEYVAKGLSAFCPSSTNPGTSVE